MDLSELRTEVFARLDEDSSDPDFYTQADVDEALNDGYEEFTDLTEWKENSFTLTLYSGKNLYDLRKYLADPDKFLRVSAIYNNQTSRWLEGSHRIFLDFFTYRYWWTITGEPEKFYLRGHWFLGLFPRKASDAGTLTVFVREMPAALSASSDTPTFWPDLHYCLVDYAVYDLLCQDREFKKANRYWQYFMEKVEEAYKRVNERGYPDRLGNIGGSAG